MPDTLRDLFLLDPSITFLNHGSFGACPRPVMEAYQRWQVELERQPVEFLGRRSGALLAASRARLAAFLGVPEDQVVYVTNATTAVNAVARSFPFRPGDEVLTSDQEYGACLNAWEHACTRAGARCVRAALPFPAPSADALVEQVWSAVTPRTRVLFLSHLTSTTALILPVAELCRRARERGIVSVVDGAHAPGQVALDLQQVGADVYTGNCHKWLCGPKGAAFLHVRPEHQAQVDAAVISWGYSAETVGHTAFDAYLGTTPFVRRHQWQGTRDLAAFLAVPAALDFLQEHRWEHVRTRCHALARDTRDRLCARTGLPPVGDDASFAQMVAIPLPPCDPLALKTFLYDQHRIEVPITVHQGQPLLRVSFQGYNRAADAEVLVNAMEAWWTQH